MPEAKKTEWGKIRAELEFDPNIETENAGMRQYWAGGENRLVRFILTCGAGLETPFMVLTVKDLESGVEQSAVCDVRPMLNAAAEALRKQINERFPNGKEK